MAFKRRTREPIDVNLTPLIDVVFILLIFFMVTTTFTRETRLKVNLPQANAEASAVVDDLIEVVIDAAGRYAVNGQRVSTSDKESLSAALDVVAGDRRDQAFFISADAKAPHQAVVTVLEIAGEMAFTGISISTQEFAE